MLAKSADMGRVNVLVHALPGPFPVHTGTEIGNGGTAAIASKSAHSTGPISACRSSNTP